LLMLQQRKTPVLQRCAGLPAPKLVGPAACCLLLAERRTLRPSCCLPMPQ
jgi:hypothetical protein